MAGTRTRWLWGLVLALASFGCSAGNSDAGEEGGTHREEIVMPEQETGDGPAVDPVDQARRDLAERLSVAGDEVEVVEVEEVTWRDTSLGCPRPGMAYAQRLVNGSRIVLRANGKDYHYHAGGGRAPFYCEDPQSPAAEGRGGGDL